MGIRDLSTVGTVRGPYSTTVTEEPLLVIHFDDSDDSVHDEAFAYVRAYGWCHTFYFIGQTVAAKLAKLTPLYDSGWDIANHGHTGVSFSGMTQLQVQTELTNCETALESNGLVGAAQHVAYPGGFYDATVLAAMTATGMITGRSTLLGVDQYFPLPDLYALSADIFFGNTTTLQEGKDWVDDVIADSRIGLGGFHKLVNVPALPTEWGISDFQALMDYIAFRGIPVLTITQLYQLNGGTPVTVNLYRRPL